MIALALLAGAVGGAAIGAYVARAAAQERCRREVAEIAGAFEAQCFHSTIATGSEVRRRLEVRSMKITSGASIS